MTTAIHTLRHPSKLPVLGTGARRPGAGRGGHARQRNACLRRGLRCGGSSLFGKDLVDLTLTIAAIMRSTASVSASASSRAPGRTGSAPPAAQGAAIDAPRARLRRAHCLLDPMTGTPCQGRYRNVRSRPKADIERLS